MSKTFYVSLKTDALMPDSDDFRLRYRWDHDYYRTLGFITSLVRDKEFNCSIYNGDPYGDYIEEHLNDLPEQEGQDFRDFIDDITERARELHLLLPPGIFERLDFNEVDPRGVSFIGILHETDYR